MSSSSANDHAAVTVDITAVISINMPPKPDCCVVWEIGAQLGLQWSRGLVTSDYSDRDGFLGDCEGTDGELTTPF